MAAFAQTGNRIGWASRPRIGTGRREQARLNRRKKRGTRAHEEDQPQTRQPGQPQNEGSGCRDGGSVGHESLDEKGKEAPAGVVVGENDRAGQVARQFIEAIAQHRHWTRELKNRTVPPPDGDETRGRQAAKEPRRAPRTQGARSS